MANIYTTKQGDTWDIISKNVYNSDAYAHLILDENLKYSYIAFFDSGIEIIIPDIDSSSSSLASSNLPPWRK